MTHQLVRRLEGDPAGVLARPLWNYYDSSESALPRMEHRQPRKQIPVLTGSGVTVRSILGIPDDKGLLPLWN
jgi:hypothetical protein